MAAKYLFRIANVCCRCAQYLDTATCGYMPRENRYMYMAHVCFSVCCSDCVRVCGNVSGVAAVVEDSFSLGVFV